MRRRKQKTQSEIQRNPNYAVAYCRFSSDRQNEASIEAQERAIKLYAEQNGITIIEWYIDKAQSAKDDNRTDFQRMKRESNELNYGKILVHKMDRFSRNILNFLQYEQEYSSKGIEIAYVAQPEMNHKFVKMIYAAMAEEFLDNLSFEATKGMIVNAEKGKRNGGVAPYGYKLEKQLDELGNEMRSKQGHIVHKVVIDPERAEAVKIMFQMTLEGFTRAEIINVLTQKGYTRNSKKGQGQTFVGTSIDNILRNERYTGEYDFHYNKGTRTRPIDGTIRVTNEFPQIISKETFDSVQKILELRKHRQPINAEEKYLLTGKIMCGDCGSQYNGMRCKRHGKMYVYYKCVNQSSYKNGQTQKEYCHNNSLQKELIEQFVIDKLKKVVFNDNFIDQVYIQYNEFIKAQSIDNSMVEMLKNKLKELDESISNFLSVISSGFSTPTIIEKIKQLEKEKEETQQKLANETSNIEFIPATKNDVVKIYRQARETLDGDNFEAKRRIINNFVNKIIVYKDKVEVYINLIPTTCCATLDLEILNTNLFSGELSIGDWDLQGNESAKNLLEYRKLCQKKNAKFKPNYELITPAPTDIKATNEQNVNSGSIFTTDIQQGQPERKLSGFWLDFFMQKNAALFRPQFPSYRPNAKLINQFRSVLSCEEIATKKDFVGNILIIRI